MDPKYLTLVSDMEKEFPGFKVVDKETSPLMKAVFYVSLMFLWNKVFMTDYTTVMFGKVYTQKELIGTERMYRVLLHERQHLRDAKKYPILFELSYLLLLPSVFTLRAWWEYRAFKETIKSLADAQGNKIYSWQVDSIVDKFTSSHYLWMFPFRKYLTNKFKQFIVSLKIYYVE